MPDYTVKADVDSMLRADNDAGIRTAIGLGQTDAPTFLNATAGTITSTVEIIAPSISKAIKFGSKWLGTDASQIWVAKSNGVVTFALSGSSEGPTIAGDMALGWTSTNMANSTATILLAQDAPGILAQRNGTAKQTLRIYNTYTSATVYERAVMDWNGPTPGNLQIGTEFLGSGSGMAARPIDFVTGGVVRMSISAAGSVIVANGALFYSSGGEFSVRGTFLDIQGVGAAAGAYIRFTQRGRITPVADGVFQLSNNANNSFTRLELGETNLGISRGTGSPEGVVTALVGSLYLRTDGTSGSSFYVKESGSGANGWVAK